MRDTHNRIFTHIIPKIIIIILLRERMIWYLDITARRERDTYSIKISDIISNIICTWICGLCVSCLRMDARLWDSIHSKWKMRWLEPAWYSARNVSSDISFTFPYPFRLAHHRLRFSHVTFTCMPKSRTCMHSYSSCSVIEFTATVHLSFPETTKVD